jgi:hypothetical protein
MWRVYNTIHRRELHPQTPNSRQTNYTKEHPVNQNTWLCVKCCYDLGIDPFAKAKKAVKKKAPAKDDRAKIVHYEQRKGAEGLGDICINVRTTIGMTDPSS